MKFPWGNVWEFGDEESHTCLYIEIHAKVLGVSQINLDTSTLDIQLMVLMRLPSLRKL
jgi:hypothetical protein